MLQDNCHAWWLHVSILLDPLVCRVNLHVDVTVIVIVNTNRDSDIGIDSDSGINGLLVFWASTRAAGNRTAKADCCACVHC